MSRTGHIPSAEIPAHAGTALRNALAAGTLDVYRRPIEDLLREVDYQTNLAARLQAKLDTNRCNRGHETLPLVLWDCPECHGVTKAKLAELVEAADYIAFAMRDGPVFERDYAAQRLAAASARGKEPA